MTVKLTQGLNCQGPINQLSMQLYVKISPKTIIIMSLQSVQKENRRKQITNIKIYMYMNNMTSRERQRESRKCLG